MHFFTSDEWLYDNLNPRRIQIFSGEAESAKNLKGEDQHLLRKTKKITVKKIIN